jgi:hypothetical protein
MERNEYESLKAERVACARRLLESQPESPAKQLLVEIHSELAIDDEWAHRSGEGFTWWGSTLAQRITATPSCTIDGFTLSRVHIETDVASDLPAVPDREEILDFVNLISGLSSLVCRDDGRVVLAASLLVHEQSLATAKAIAPTIAGVQLDVGGRTARLLAEKGAGSSASAHPVSGPRAIPDEMAVLLVGHIRDQARLRPAASSIYSLLAAEMNDHGCPCTASETGLTAWVPSRSFPAQIQAEAGAEHPLLGVGVGLSLQLPVSDPDLDRVVRHLNQRALDRSIGPRALHALGGWRVDRELRVPTLAIFVPALVALDAVVADLIVYLGALARTLGEDLA